MTRPDSFTAPLPPVETNDGAMLTWMGTDAVRWARVFQRNVEALPDTADPDEFGGMLIGWFANAIEAGRDVGRTRERVADEVDARSARTQLQADARTAYGAHDALVAAGAVAIVEAIDQLTGQVQRLADALLDEPPAATVPAAAPPLSLADLTKRADR